MRKPVILVAFLFGSAGVVSAQQHAAVVVSAPPVAMRPVSVGATVPAAHTVPGHPPVAAHPVHQGAASNVKPAIPHRRTPATLASRPISPAPLGGFVNSVTAGNATCNRHGSFPGLNACTPTTGVVLPVFGGGIYVPMPYYVDSSAPQEAQQADAQEEAANQPTDGNPRDTEQSSAYMAPSRSTTGNPINESLSEFVFVQRDGSKFYAVAYSFLNDKLHYVTKDGTRRSVALDLLDFDATQKSNEDLGNTINLPSLPASGVAMNVLPSVLR